MMRFVEKHPWMTFFLVLAGLSTFTNVFGNKSANAAPQPGPHPGPLPAPPSPGQLTSANNPFPIFPGSSSLTIGQGSGFMLQLQPGATWDTEGGYPPVSQQLGGSVLGGTVNPIVPIVGSSAPQAWDNVTGNGTLVLYWKDASGTPQATNIVVTTVGGAHALGG
jgi:hypothetical protein